MTKLCLNMIVRNEADKMERCLTALVPHIDCWVVHDTGSSDDTVDFIENFFERRGIPGHVTHGQFVDFSQARNEGLASARASKYDWDYLLLCDADMELVVEDNDFKKQLTGIAHTLVQKGSGVAYENTRFISRQSACKYVGVTHEYIDVASAGTIKGVWYNDHADGSNRPNKFKRDIRLLKKGLQDEPNNGRYWFYLAQSYQDAGRWDDAIRAYDKRIALGGWDEETYICKFRRAQCFGNKGVDNEFVSGLLDAYNFRPHRAEALYDLAHHYRMKGHNAAALLFTEAGLQLKPSGDVLFVNEFPVQAGFREEFSIAGYYNETKRPAAAKVTNWLALDPSVPEATRGQARTNLVHYVKPLFESVPSFITRRIAFDPPDGFTAMNPCVTIGYDDMIMCNVRAVNYTMDEHGRYLIKGTNGEANGTNPINTRNFVVSMRDNFDPAYNFEVLPPEGFPPPLYNLVVGFEDMRVFKWREELWSISNVREQNPEGWCEQMVAVIGPQGRLVEPHKILPRHRQHEKNWAPLVMDTEFMFVYNIGSIIYPASGSIIKYRTPYAAEHIRGGSQYVPFRGGYLSLTHEAYHHANGKRYYLHRFSYYDPSANIWKLSMPFVFHEKVIEFAAGIAMHPRKKQVLMSYGREDKEAWIASADEAEIAEFVFS